MSMGPDLAAATVPGATYATTRGDFMFLENWPATYAVRLGRADGRHVLVAMSDWLTWRPVRSESTSCDLLPTSQQNA